jgi:hypothetical protein
MQPPRTTERAGVARGPRGSLCDGKPRRAVLFWLTWRPTEAHAAVLLCPGCHSCLYRSARRRAVVLWLLTWRHGRSADKRTPPCCCALAVHVSPRRSARRRAVVPLGCRRACSVNANPAVLFCSGWRGARQKRTPPCCCALADVAVGAPPGEGVFFYPPEGGVSLPRQHLNNTKPTNAAHPARCNAARRAAVVAQLQKLAGCEIEGK